MFSSRCLVYWCDVCGREMNPDYAASSNLELVMSCRADHIRSFSADNSVSVALGKEECCAEKTT